MVSKKTIRLALLSPWLMLIPAILLAIIYLIVPAILVGVSDNDDVCSYPEEQSSYSGQPSVAYAMADLCHTSQVFLGVLIMLIIVLSGLSSIASVVLVTIDILQKQDMEGLHKALWLAAIWLALGYFAAAAYYIMVKEKGSDPVQ
jgi:hypothetical protein